MPNRLGSLGPPKDMGNDSTQPRNKAHKLPTPRGEAKGLDTIGKREKHQSTTLANKGASP